MLKRLNSFLIPKEPEKHECASAKSSPKIPVITKLTDVFHNRVQSDVEPVQFQLSKLSLSSEDLDSQKIAEVNCEKNIPLRLQMQITFAYKSVLTGALENTGHWIDQVFNTMFVHYPIVLSKEDLSDIECKLQKISRALQKGTCSERVSSCLRALRKSPLQNSCDGQDPLELILHAESRFIDSRYTSSIELLQKILGSGVENFYTYNLLSIIYQIGGDGVHVDQEKAKKYFQLAQQALKI